MFPAQISSHVGNRFKLQYPRIKPIKIICNIIGQSKLTGIAIGQRQPLNVRRRTQNKSLQINEG